MKFRDGLFDFITLCIAGLPFLVTMCLPDSYSMIIKFVINFGLELVLWGIQRMIIKRSSAVRNYFISEDGRFKETYDLENCVNLWALLELGGAFVNLLIEAQ